MLDPCIGCKLCPHMVPLRKVDCLAQFPNLRAIGNSRGGFAATNSSAGWYLPEIMFYNSQINLTYGRAKFPDVL